MNRIKVLIVDDSALIRKLLTEILESDPELEVVGTAVDPYMARDKIKKFQPDVITLDVEMPKMDGITFLRNLMRLRPLPVVMISTLTDAGADITLQALELGAVDFVSKPRIDVNQSIKHYSEEIIEKVKMAARVPLTVLEDISHAMQGAAKNYKNSPMLQPASGHSGAGFLNTTDKIIAIGSSTGGTEAVKKVLMSLPPDVCGIVVTQHIPGAFSGPFARRLDDETRLNVTEAREGDRLLPGSVFIAPGDRHLIIKRSGARYYCHLSDAPEINRHRPSVDALFNSIAQCAGPNGMGIMLTGMGADGAQGMLEMHRRGAFNIAQDENSSVVWGMPGAAVKLEAVDKIVALSDIYKEIINYCQH